jgi:CheY-like chemotaxis protein
MTFGQPDRTPVQENTQIKQEMIRETLPCSRRCSLAVARVNRVFTRRNRIGTIPARQTAPGPVSRRVYDQVPDVVILDISLPVMNGFEVAQRIRLLAPSTRIVLFSIHDVPATARDIGVDAFVAKSSGVEALAATLERVCATLPCD